MEFWSHGIQMYSTHREHSFTITTNLPSMPQGNSTTKEYCKALIKKQQMDILEELSISTYELGQTVWCFNTLDKIWKPAVILEPAPTRHSYWCKMEESNQKLRRTQLHIKPCLNTTECEEKNARKDPDGRKPCFSVYTSYKKEWIANSYYYIITIYAI